MNTESLYQFQTINPFTNKVLGSYKLMTWEHVKQKIDEGHKGFQIWSKLTFLQRATYFYKLAILLRERKEEYGALITSEMGKPIVQAVAEVEKCAWVCEYYADNAANFLETQSINTEFAKSYLSYQPLGVILQIMPWNFPFWQVFRFAVPELMAGNVSLIKDEHNVVDCDEAIE